jgi:hypothetical protein
MTRYVDERNDDPLGLAEALRPLLQDASPAEHSQIVGGLQAALAAASRAYLGGVAQAKGDPQERALREAYEKERAGLRRGDAVSLVRLKSRFRRAGLKDV